jgi:1-phosphatidylinositol-3-phosphate 5-kinase
MSKFAPKYFEYMSTAISSKVSLPICFAVVNRLTIVTQRPTVLAKIFGFYKIVYKNSDMGKTVRMTLLVMENLFHEHASCQVR